VAKKPGMQEVRINEIQLFFLFFVLFAESAVLNFVSTGELDWIPTFLRLSRSKIKIPPANDLRAYRLIESPHGQEGKAGSFASQ